LPTESYVFASFRVKKIKNGMETIQLEKFFNMFILSYLILKSIIASTVKLLSYTKATVQNSRRLLRSGLKSMLNEVINISELLDFFI